MKLGLFGGGFKPFTTGHFAKLANAIRDNDMTYLYYTIQETEPVLYYKRPYTNRKTGQKFKKGDARPPIQDFRSIGSTGCYDEKCAKDIFSIYERALNNMDGVRVFPIYTQAKDEHGNPLKIRSPITAIFTILDDFLEAQAAGEDYFLDGLPEPITKITLYGDSDSFKPYMRAPRVMNFLDDPENQGKIQFGAIEATRDDYIDSERFARKLAASEESALSSLAAYYPDLSREEIERMKSVRGSQVRSLASKRVSPPKDLQHLGSDSAEVAKKFLPPFLSDRDKGDIVNILLTQGENSSDKKEDFNEALIRNLIRGFIRG